MLATVDDLGNMDIIIIDDDVKRTRGSHSVF